MKGRKTKSVSLEMLPDPEHRFSLYAELLDFDVDGDTFNALCVTGWGTFDGAPVRRAAAVWRNEMIATTDCYSDPETMPVVRPAFGKAWKWIADDAPVFFILRIPRFRLPRDGAVTLHLDCRRSDGEYRWVPAARLSGALAPRLTAQPTGPIPVLIPSVGRSGTTLLMRCLAAHPDVVVVGDYPYEFRQASYLWRAFDILAAPADHDNSLHPVGLGELSAPLIGQNPYATRPFQKVSQAPSIAEWQTEAFPQSLAQFVRQSVASFVSTAARDYKKPTAKFFAEKMPPSPLIHVVRNLDERTKIIFVLRDLRDIALSMRSFSGWKTSMPSLNGSEDITVEWVTGLCNFVDILMDYRDAYQDSSTLLRYEDLMANPETALSGIFDYLGVANDTGLTRAIVKSALKSTDFDAQHITSASPAASVERWKTALPAAIQAVFEQSASRVLERSGYDVS